MRAFIAIDLPPGIKETIGRLQARLKRSCADVTWVSPQNMHLTLKFLGEIDDTARDAISSAVTAIALTTPSYPIKLGAAGAFPGIRSPRVIWIGLAQGHEQTRSIVAALETKLEPVGIARETRPFSSHITIGRVRSSTNVRQLADSLSEAQEMTSDPFGGFQAGKITFFKSTLTAQGPVYEILQETNLKTT